MFHEFRLAESADSVHPGASPQTAEEYRQSIESFAQAFWETDAAGQVVKDSLNWRAYTGQTLEQWLGEGWTAAVHPNDRSYSYALSQWQKAVETQTPVDAEFRLQSAQGGWRWTNVRATPIRNPDGAISKWMGLNIDIAEKKQSEEVVSKSEQKYRTLFNSIDEGFSLLELIFDDKGDVVDYWHRDNNPSFARMTGITDFIDR